MKLSNDTFGSQADFYRRDTHIVRYAYLRLCSVPTGKPTQTTPTRGLAPRTCLAALAFLLY